MITRIATILFLLVSQIFIILKANNMCYKNGQAKICMAPFINAVKNLSIEVTSTCGEKKMESVCTRNQQGYETVCSICKSNSHPKIYINDNELSKQTYWLSGPITKTSPGNIVNITVSLGKSFEVYYVSLIICGTMPHAIALYKQTDHNNNWIPWQYYSNDCFSAFRMPAETESTGFRSSGIYEVTCLSLPTNIVFNDNGCMTEALTFNTYNSENPWYKWSDKVFDWMTLTKLRVSLIRLDYDMSGPELDIAHYGLSNLDVGGRCKCNGHAKDCIKVNGEIRCMCKHNTDGKDCERCKQQYLDRPWKRATKHDANICKPCNCNGHSQNCMFKPELYQKTKGLHGGVCLDCLHNTEGTNCDRCAYSYYRDSLKPLSHPLVCKECKCQSYGSLHKDCDKISGKCNCRPYVYGHKCDRCIDGYSQTNDMKKPCKRRKDSNNIPFNTSPQCNCKRKRKRIKFKKFCRRPAVFQAEVKLYSKYTDKTRIELKILKTWRMKKRIQKLLPTDEDIVSVWIDNSRIKCHCPNIKTGRRYLFLSKTQTYRHKSTPYEHLFLGDRSIVLPWKDTWNKRLDGFRLRENQGGCKYYYRLRRMMAKHRNYKRRNRHANVYRSKSVQKNNQSRKPFKQGSNYGYYEHI